jgi:hypothetical protein
MKIVILDSYTLNPGALSWATLSAMERLMKISIDNLRSFIEGNPENMVN